MQPSSLAPELVPFAIDLGPVATRYRGHLVASWRGDPLLALIGRYLEPGRVGMVVVSEDPRVLTVMDHGPYLYTPGKEPSGLAQPERVAVAIGQDGTTAGLRRLAGAGGELEPVDPEVLGASRMVPALRRCMGLDSQARVGATAPDAVRVARHWWFWAASLLVASTVDRPDEFSYLFGELPITARSATSVAVEFPEHVLREIPVPGGALVAALHGPRGPEAWDAVVAELRTLAASKEDQYWAGLSAWADRDLVAAALGRPPDSRVCAAKMGHVPDAFDIVPLLTPYLDPDVPFP